MKTKIFVENTLFLGRTQEQTQFRVALQELINQSPEEDLPYVMLIYGDGGMGKTTLAKRLRDIALLEQPYQGEFQILWVDWEDERTRSIGLNVGHKQINPEVVFEVIHSAIIRNNLGSFFTDYQTIVKQVAQAEKQVAQALTTNNQYDDLVQIKGLGTGALASLVRSGVPAIGQTGEKLVETFLNAGIKVSAEQAAKIRAILETRLRAVLSQKQYEIFLNPQEQLARALAQGIKKLSIKKPTIIFLDTYEIVDQIDVWMRLVIKNSGSKVFWVLSGRNDLSKSRRFGYKSSDYMRGYAEDFSNALILVEMRQLALDDMRIYFHYSAPNRAMDENTVSTLSQATRGIPLAVSEAAEMWSKGVALLDIAGDSNESTPANQIVQKMTDRYLIHAVIETDKKALFALALARGDIEILNSMLRPSDEASFDLDSELHRLERDYASVHYELAKLHEEPTLFILEYLKDEKRRQSDLVKELVQKAIKVLDARLDSLMKIHKTIEERCKNEQWVASALHETNYLFWLGEGEVWDWFIRRYVESLAYNNFFRQSLLKVAQSWEAHLGEDGKRRLEIIKKPEVSTSDVLEAEIELYNELSKLMELGWFATKEAIAGIERMSIMYLWAGTLNFRTGKYEQALEIYKSIYTITKKYPGISKGLKEQISDAWASAAAQQVDKENNHTQMVQTYKNIIKFESKNPSAYHHLAHSLIHLGRYKEAITAFQNAISLQPRDLSHYDCLGQLQESQGRFGEAAETFQKAIEVGQRYGYESSVFHNQFNRFHQNKEDSSELPSILSKLYHNLGHTQEKADQLQNAINSFKEAITLEPNKQGNYVCLGKILADHDRNNEALEILEQGLKVDSSNATIHHELGHVFGNLNNLEASISSFLKSIELAPNEVTNYSCFGQVLIENELYDKSESVFQKALELTPTSYVSYSGLALINYLRRDYKKAYDLYKKSHKLKPRSATLIGMAGTSQHLHKLKQAQKYLELIKKFSLSEYELACVESIKGNNKGAILHLKVAVKKNPALKKFAKTDPDLFFIRDDPNLKVLIEEKSTRKKRISKNL